MSIESDMPAQPDDENQKKQQSDSGFDVGDIVVDGLSAIGRGSRGPSAPEVPCGDSAAAVLEAGATTATESAAAGAEAAAAAGEAAGGIVDGVASVIGGILDGL